VSGHLLREEDLGRREDDRRFFFQIYPSPRYNVADNAEYEASKNFGISMGVFRGNFFYAPKISSLLSLTLDPPISSHLSLPTFP
jgi:hypothetical protein